MCFANDWDIVLYIAIPIALIVLWTGFLAFSSLKTNWKSLRPEVKIVGIFIIIPFFLLDLVLNWIPGIILGPSFGTLSQKCSALRKSDMGWRGDVAEYLCDNWLNPFDNNHC